MEQIYDLPDFKRFKFKSLKIYSSTEWLADNKKKYRQVFDKNELSYIYSELSFYNKFYDHENWEVGISLKCYELTHVKKKVCSLDIKRKVSKFDNLVFVREGWGNKTEGAFWKEGTYYWEAWIEGEKVATKYFYVEESGEILDYKSQNYIQLQGLRLYEGKYDDVNEDDRIYCNVFSAEESRYIYAELNFANILHEKPWHCELFIKFYNESRELKWKVNKLHTVKQAEDQIKISVGCGTNVKGGWRKGAYTLEVVFMDELIAIVPFTVGDEFVEGPVRVQLPSEDSLFAMIPQELSEQDFEEVMLDLDALVGLQAIKQKVRDHSKYIQFLRLRREKGFLEKEIMPVHAIYTGNPGTGKTTVAKMMGALYKKMGLLTKGHVTEVDRVDLVGEYIGQTAPKVKEVLEKARGGVLFIDEAYSLARAKDDSKDFGREVIEILMKEMSNGVGDLVVIAAGYPKEMDYFLSSNPGLKSRFKLKFDFRDYLPKELMKIAEFAANEKEIELAPAAKVKLDELIIDAFRDRDKTFGNARFVYDLMDKAKLHLGLRIMNKEYPDESSKEEISIIEVGDLNAINLNPKRQMPEIPVDEKLLDMALAELNQLVGIQSVKDQIYELVSVVKYHLGNKKEVLNKFFFHTVLVGNPGTGKTTVARILAKIYKALGILERGHMVETDRQGLVAGYMGQTAIKTAEQIDNAMGGVLFIDEAYMLGQVGAHQSDFGHEAIQTILKRMEDHRGEFFVFAAGYPENMDKFLKTNPGLNSRFDKVLKFEDYDAATLMQIAKTMIDQEQLLLDAQAAIKLQEHIAELYEGRDKYFGNARNIRQLILELLKAQQLRLATDQPDSADEQKMILPADIDKAISYQPAEFVEKKRIRFGA